MQTEDTKKIWNECLESIQVSVSPAIYSTWFKQTKLKTIESKNSRALVNIACISTYVKSTIESRYFGLIQDTLGKILDQPIDLIFNVEEITDNDAEEDKNTDTPLFNTKTDQKEILNNLAKSGVRATLTFENYAVSSTNQMAWAAAEAVTNNPGMAYNPLFVWGGVGVGKTHLMNAVGYNIIKDNEKKALFCTGETFTNDIVEGIRTKSTQKVRQKYRKLDVLMLDDVQFIAGKDAVQEEFFHTFNALVGASKQIILTSDRPPTEIAKLEDRLRSRFEAGLIVDISPPDFELRCAITQIKAKERGIDLQSDWVHIIAGNISTPREIEGFLVKLYSQASVAKTEISEDLIKGMLNKSGPDNGREIKANAAEVIGAVSKYYSIIKKDLLGKSRKRKVARPRQVLMYILKTDLGLPYQEVGRLIGGRDHTTVMHAVDKITDLASSNVDIRQDISGIKSVL